LKMETRTETLEEIEDWASKTSSLSFLNDLTSLFPYAAVSGNSGYKFLDLGLGSLSQVLKKMSQIFEVYYVEAEGAGWTFIPTNTKAYFFSLENNQAFFRV
jgi:hypothetical protein